MQILSSFLFQYPLPSVFFLFSSYAGFISIWVFLPLLPLLPLWPLQSPNHPLLLLGGSSLQPAALVLCFTSTVQASRNPGFSPYRSKQCDLRGCDPMVCYEISTWEWYKQFMLWTGQTLVSSLERRIGSDLQYPFNLNIMSLSLLTV